MSSLSSPRRRLAALLAALLAAPAFLVAGDGDALAAPPRVPKLDPKVVRAVQTGLLGASQGHSRRPGPAPVLIELDAPVTAASLAALRAAGATLTEVDGKPLSYDRFVPAHVSAEAAVAVAALSAVRRVALLSGSGPLPLDHSAELLRLDSARGSRPALDLMTGKGVVIADVDSLVDPFHPTFFRGDAGYFDWIDVDHDGAFNPMVDAIDLNRNGALDPGELAQVVRAETVDYYAQIQTGARADGFDPGIDWLFLDTNGNGQRDYGNAAGFDDTTPALGEPLFVPDDVNRNGKLDVGERVVRLGTSKFAKIYVNVNDASLKLKASHVYERGKDLAGFVVDYSGGKIYGSDDADHATGVQTILGGDVPLVGRRWVGLAPDADLLVAWDIEDSEPLPVNALTWALGEHPDVMLYELAPWTGNALDGSDPLSTLIDASSAAVTHTCPTGDEGSAGKHTSADITAGANASFAFSVPKGAPKGYPTKDQRPISEVELSLNLTLGLAAKVTITSAASDVVSLDLTQAGPFTGTLAGGASYYATVEQTPRGTQFLDVYFYASAANAPPASYPPPGEWTVSVGAQTALHADAYLNDDVSSWGVGAEWDAAIANGVSLVGIPSVADHCIAVGAHPDHVPTAASPWYAMYYDDYNVPPGYAEAQGQVRAYSPLGPRIDGAQKPDVLAPDNPWVASCHVAGSTYEKPYGSFNVFGGTSGAGPHVAGTAALLAQAGVHGDAARAAIRAGAVADATTGAVPNTAYGYGRLDAAGALGVKAVETGGPSITLSVSPSAPSTGEMVAITPAVEGAGGGATGLQVKWDDGYDGTWDTAYAAPAAHAVTTKTAGKLPFKARVRDAAGHIAEAIVWVTFSDAGSSSSGGGGTPSASASSSGGTSSGGQASSPTKGGCGCRVAGSGPEGAFGGVALALSAALACRRRRG